MFYLDLFGALARHRVRYVAVGGLTPNLHSVKRATMDADLAVDLDPSNVGEAIDAFTELGPVPVPPVKIQEERDPLTPRRWLRDKNKVAFGLRPGKGPVWRLIA